MENLALFIRVVRECQGITQKELAGAAKISQSAIAQYEKLQATLSLETLLNIAPLLNLNPEFIEKGTGNPFKQINKQEIIKMFLPEDSLGKIDFSIIDFIFETNDETTFILLTPSRWLSARYMLKSRDLSYAILAEDCDRNRFLFRRKDARNHLVGIRDLTDRLENLDKEGKKCFEIKSTGLSDHLFKAIEEWSHINVKELDALLKTVNRGEHIDFLRRLIKKIWSHKSMKNKKEAEKIRKVIRDMENEDLDRLIARLMPEFANVLEKHLHLENIPEEKKNDRLMSDYGLL